MTTESLHAAIELARLTQKTACQETKDRLERSIAELQRQIDEAEALAAQRRLRIWRWVQLFASIITTVWIWSRL